MYGISMRNPDWLQAVKQTDNTKFKHVELTISNVNSDSILFDKPTLQNVKDLCAEKGLSLSLHCLRGINLGEKVDRIRQASIEIVRDCLHVCNFLSARWLTIHLGTARIANNDKRKYDRLDIVASALNLLLKDCNDTVIGIENERYVMDYSKPTRLGDSPLEIRYVLNSINDQRIKVIYDVGHSLLYKDLVKEYLLTLKKDIIGVHLHSNDGMNDLHLPITAHDKVLTIDHVIHIESIVREGIPLIFECKTLKDNEISYGNYLSIIGGI